MNEQRRAFIFCPVFAAIAALVRRLRIDPPPPEPRHLYAIRNDDDGTTFVCVATHARHAWATHYVTRRNPNPATYGLDELQEIPDGLLVPYVDAAGLLVEEPAALLARNSPLVDVCIFSKSECQLWLRPAAT